MTTKQIEALVQSVEGRMYNELGEYPRIDIMGYKSGEYDVQLCWDHAGVEHSEIVVNDLTDDELEHFLQNDVDAFIREFYYCMRNGMTLWAKAHVQLAVFVAKELCVPTDVYVDIRWKKDGEVRKHVCICCSCEMALAAEIEDGDDSYFLYCESYKQFFHLLRRDNGQDFEIIEVHGWD